MDELITVIVPVYNVCNYLDRCLDSIVNQTYKNLDILIIDDGSTDGSSKICDMYRRKDKRVRVIHKRNEGIAITRNLGIKMSLGKYIGFVDSDDYISLDMYTNLHDLIITYKTDIAICNYTEFSNECLKLNTGSGNIIVYNRIEALSELLKDNIITSHSVNKLFKKDVFNNVLCPKNRKYEDVSYIYKTINNSKKIVYIDKILYAYYQRSGSTVHTINKKNICDFYKAYAERNKFLENNVLELSNDWIESDKIFSILLLNLLIAKSGDKNLYDMYVVKKSYLLYKKIFSLKRLFVVKKSKRILAILLYFNRNLFYKLLYILYKFKEILVK